MGVVYYRMHTQSKMSSSVFSFFVQEILNMVSVELRHIDDVVSFHVFFSCCYLQASGL